MLEKKIMALQKYDDRWWSDIIRTEIRLPLKGPRRFCVLLPLRPGARLARATVLKKMTDGLVSKARALVARHLPAMSPGESADPAEAYLHACLAVPFFCYVSPATYGLADEITSNKQGIERSAPGPEDAV
ncbi:hypothetical protein [Agrobacterium pusense]|uniref:hypothetical protein n=2 Tax=Agrobacterium TaxID=357 RepID=UPI001F384D66|nr:hypothetical protein [Agrobacterium pusense]